MLRTSLLAAGVAAAIVSSLPVSAQPAGKTPQPEVDDVISVTGARRREEAMAYLPAKKGDEGSDLTPATTVEPSTSTKIGLL